jgi:tetratricopeptide (TPR) repeat protein
MATTTTTTDEQMNNKKEKKFILSRRIKDKFINTYISSTEEEMGYVTIDHSIFPNAVTSSREFTEKEEPSTDENKNNANPRNREKSVWKSSLQPTEKIYSSQNNNNNSGGSRHIRKRSSSNFDPFITRTEMFPRNNKEATLNEEDDTKKKQTRSKRHSASMFQPGRNPNILPSVSSSISSNTASVNTAAATTIMAVSHPLSTNAKHINSITYANVLRTVLKEGQEDKKFPSENCRCRINYTISHRVKHDTILVEQMENVNFIIGEGELCTILEDCVRLMRVNEMSIFVCDMVHSRNKEQISEHCHRHTAKLKTLLEQPKCSLEIIIQLLSFTTEEEEWWNYMLQFKTVFKSHRMLFTLVQQKQIEAKALRMENRYKFAEKRLTNAFDLLESYCEATPWFFEKKCDKVLKLAFSLLFDLAEIYSIQKEYSKTVNICNIILRIERNNVQALVYRARAFKSQNNLKMATSSYMQALEFVNSVQLKKQINDDLQLITDSKDKYQVSIVSTEEKSDKTYYIMRVQNDPLAIDIYLSKRYSEFQTLYETLLKKNPSLSNSVSFPPVSWFFKHSSSVVNARAEKFNQFLKFIFSSKEYYQLAEVTDFIVIK